MDSHNCVSKLTLISTGIVVQTKVWILGAWIVIVHELSN